MSSNRLTTEINSYKTSKRVYVSLALSVIPISAGSLPDPAKVITYFTQE
jgi:hypothetical protein